MAHSGGEFSSRREIPEIVFYNFQSDLSRGLIENNNIVFNGQIDKAIGL